MPHVRFFLFSVKIDIAQDNTFFFFFYINTSPVLRRNPDVLRIEKLSKKRINIWKIYNVTPRTPSRPSCRGQKNKRKCPMKTHDNIVSRTARAVELMTTMTTASRRLHITLLKNSMRYETTTNDNAFREIIILNSPSLTKHTQCAQRNVRRLCMYKRMRRKSNKQTPYRRRRCWTNREARRRYCPNCVLH